MQLYDHQQQFIDRNPDKELLCWDTGTGKTIASIAWANLRNRPALFVCPKSIKGNWKEEVEEHGEGEVLKSKVMTKEEFRRDYKKIDRYDTIIYDEAHYVSGMKSQMSKNFAKYIKAHSPQSILLMTATPYLSTPWNIYRLAGYLGHEWNYLDYREKFFRERYIGRNRIYVPKDGIEDDMAKLVEKIGDVVRLDECADVPDQVFETEHFEETKKQKLRKEMLEEIKPIVRFTKYHQIENGTLKGDQYNEHEFIENEKIERIKELASNHKKIAFVARYNLQIDHIKRELEDYKDTKKCDIWVIRGDTKDRKSVVEEVEAADDAIVIINAATSEGYELPSIPVCVFASLSFSYKDYKQMIGRFLRINKLKKNVYIHLVVKGDIDEAVYGSIKKKKDFDIAIYARENENAMV